MDESFDTLKRDLVDVMQQLRRTGGTRVAPQGVTPVEARTVFTVAMTQKEEGSARPRAVAARMCATPSALSQTLKSLEEKGLIARSRGEADFRAVSLELTEAGQAIANEVDRLHTEHVQKVLEYVGKEDCEHLVATLKKILEFHRGESEQDGTDAQSPCTGKDGGPCA